MSLNLASIPVRAAFNYPEAPALLLGEKVINYASLKQQIERCAALLSSRGIGRGDHVAVVLPNVPQFTVNYFAVHYLGAVVVPLNVLFVEEELTYHLQDCDAKALVVWEDFLGSAQPAAAAARCHTVFVCRAGNSNAELPDGLIDQGMAMQQLQDDSVGLSQPEATNADDTAVILYTSGTTGRAKGAELSHFNMYDNARFVAERLLRSDDGLWPVFSRGDVALASLPLFHSFGQTVVQNAFLMHGAAITLLPRFTAQDAARVIAAHEVTFFAGVPSMYIALLNDPAVSGEQLHTLRCAVSGGAPLPAQVLEQFHKQFGVEIQEGYGLSETSPVACFNMRITGCRPGSVGPAIDLCEVKIVDAKGKELPPGERGEIVIKGSNVMKGYYKRAAETAEVLRDGWFYSGDIGTLDEDGFVYIVDRKKELIIRNGFNVYPREIEEILYKHPDITEAAVIGIADKIHGEEVIALLCVKPGVSLTSEQVESYCREHLAAYKVPRKTYLLEALPKGPTGKILKRKLKEQYCAD